ncbi:UNVERIFIED_CONTAM: phospholipase D-like protein [Williamsia faeni]
MWDSFWDFIWYSIVIFAFVAYLMILFYVLADLFRDRSTSGWLKGVWIFFLIIVPYITLFVYLIARGRGMAERTVEAQKVAKEQSDTYIRQVAGASATDQIAAAKALHTEGTINDAEFEQLKAKALNS